MSYGKKLVLHCPWGNQSALDAMVEQFIADGVEVVCVVGKDCSLVEDIIDELVVGDGSDQSRFILTSAHPDESMESVIAFAGQLDPQDTEPQLVVLPRAPVDRHGHLVRVGARVRLLSLSGKWFDELPSDERVDVQSMIGGIFDVEEIDEYGFPWIRKSWPETESGRCHSHSIALDRGEFEVLEASVMDTAPHEV